MNTPTRSLLRSLETAFPSSWSESDLIKAAVLQGADIFKATSALTSLVESDQACRCEICEEIYLGLEQPGNLCESCNVLAEELMREEG